MLNRLLRVAPALILFCLTWIQIGCDEPYDQVKEIQTEIKEFIRRTFLKFHHVERLDIGVEVLANTLDGSARRECVARDEVQAGRTYAAWVSFGEVKLHDGQGWEALGSISRCGNGFFDFAHDSTSGKVDKPIVRAHDHPYLVVDIEMISTAQPGEKVDLQATLKIRKLSTFDMEGRPVYAQSEEKRRFDLAEGDDAIIPILLADRRESDAFGVNELFLRLRPLVLGQREASYGTISITADVPGEDIFLDGGFVGRTLEEGPFLLRNVLVGKHDVRVKDLSGREASNNVVVEKGRTAKVALELLNLAMSQGNADLVPIGKNLQGYDEYWRTRDGIVVVKVPAGEFIMGSVEGEGEPDEYPQHRVVVKEFLMDKTEVSWRQFRKFSKSTGTPLPPAPLWGTPDDYPVTGVRFDEAKAYCEWVGGRLPTEAEWEKAARGTDGRIYPWGNEWDPDRCNSFDGGPHRPQAVGSFPECLSPYGLVDMAGSVWEWCADWYADGYTRVAASDSKGPEAGSLRVLRGGYWLSQALLMRIAHRHKSDPSWRNVNYGFRCVQAVPK